jgi:tRNA(Arg) A34 adenosine deaminase TadA
LYDHIKIAEKTYKYTGKTGRYMELARRLANQSIFPEYKHGAVLVKGGTVRNGSFNKSNYCSFGHRFRKKEYGIPTLHAEIGTVLGVDRTVTEGATVYVARVGKGNDFKMSKPCPMCREALRHCGVKRVVYTIDDKIAGSYKL